MFGWLMRTSGFVAAILIFTALGCAQTNPAGVPGDTAANLLSNGQTAYRQGHLNEARKLLEEAVRLAPRSANAHALLGLTLARQGYLNGALAQMGEASKLNPSNSDFAYNDALMLLRARRYSAAIPVLEKLSGASPDAADVRVNLARAYAATGNLAKLSACVQQLPASMFGDTALLQTLASVLAGAHANTAIEQLWLRAISYNPDEPLGYAVLAKLYIADGQPARALSALQRAPATARSPVYVYALGETQEALGQYSQARASFERLAQTMPANQAAWRRLIECDLRADQLQDASHDALLATRRFPYNSLFSYQTAVIDYLLGRNSAAIAALEPALQRKREAGVQAVLLMAVLQSATGQYAEAVRYFTRAQALAGSCNALAAYFYGATLLRMHRATQAAAQFQTALRCRPHFALAEYRLGLALSQAGKSRQALEALKSAARDNSNLAESYYAMAQIERKLGQAHAAKLDLAQFSARSEHVNLSDRTLIRGGAQ